MLLLGTKKKKKSFMRNTCLYSLFFLFIFTSNTLIGQSGDFETYTLQKATESFEYQDYDAALTNYKKLSANYPNKPEYKYKEGLCQYRLKNYKKAIKIGNKLIELNPEEAKYYRLLANAYDLNGDYERGVETLNMGIRIMPTDGGLYFDKGVIEMERGNTKQAVENWEAGIKGAPYFADNYYWVAKTYADSDQKIWSIMYAEMFLNLERGTDRFTEISKLLTDTYLSLFREIPNIDLGETFINKEEQSAKIETAYDWMVTQLRNGDTLTLSSVPERFINAKPKRVDSDMVMANNSLIQLQNEGAFIQFDRIDRNKFEEAYLYVLTILRENGILNIPVSGRLDDGSYNFVKAVSFIRSNFVELWMQLFHQDMPITLFIWQFDLFDRKLFDSYNHWLMSSGDPNYFLKWQQSHNEEYQIFLDALISKPLKVDAQNYFVRTDYITK